MPHLVTQCFLEGHRLPISQPNELLLKALAFSKAYFLYQQKNSFFALKQGRSCSFQSVKFYNITSDFQPFLFSLHIAFPLPLLQPPPYHPHLQSPSPLGDFCKRRSSILIFYISLLPAVIGRDGLAGLGVGMGGGDKYWKMLQELIINAFIPLPPP